MLRILSPCRHRSTLRFHPILSIRGHSFTPPEQLTPRKVKPTFNSLLARAVQENDLSALNQVLRKMSRQKAPLDQESFEHIFKVLEKHKNLFRSDFVRF